MFARLQLPGSGAIDLFYPSRALRIEHSAANKRLVAVEHSRHIVKHARGSAGNPEPDVRITPRELAAGMHQAERTCWREHWSVITPASPVPGLLHEGSEDARR